LLDRFRRADTHSHLTPTAQLFLDLWQAFEERLDVREQVTSRMGQLERPPMKQGHAQAIFQLDQLRADRRLLNAIRNVSRRSAHTSMLRHVLDQLQMMNIHGA